MDAGPAAADCQRIDSEPICIKEPGVDIQSLSVTANGVVNPPLSREANDVLIAAANSGQGQVILARSTGGLSLSIDGQSFLAGHSAQDEARYEHAVRQLVSSGLLSGGNGVYHVTHMGFLARDAV